VKDVLDIHRALLGRGVAHEVVRLPRAIAAADEIPDATGLPAHRCAVVRHYLVDEALVAAVVPAGSTMRPAAVLTALQATTITAAPAEIVNRVTDYAVALASPLLQPEEVTVLMDLVLLREEVLYVPTGDSGTVIGIPSATLAAESDARLVELTTGAEIDLRTPARRALSAVPEVTTTQPAATAANPPELTFAGRPAHPRH
jgi:prolyl-tRNA editing enzyme YbaK/EbsC (Cys-tRNA(Pro) deacylase)